MRGYINWRAWWLASMGLLAMMDDAGSASVYECRVAGQRVFSDQRCGDDAQQRDIAAANSMPAPQIHSSKTGTVAPKSRRAAAGNDLSKQRLACHRIREQVDSVHAHMRSGYRGAQGERLTARLRELNARYKQQRCEYFHD